MTSPGASRHQEQGQDDPMGEQPDESPVEMVGAGAIRPDGHDRGGGASGGAGKPRPGSANGGSGIRVESTAFLPGDGAHRGGDR